VDRYGAFLERFPTVNALALADEQEVLAAWSGLGYYRRARMLHKAAQSVIQNHQGKLHANAEALRSLPGIGVYTAAAISSIAHGECVAVVDGNVERVLCRLQGWGMTSRATSGPLKRQIAAMAARLVDPAHPGDFNQAIMELGATVCAPRNPGCPVCPIRRECQTRGEHRTAPRPAMLSREIAHALALRSPPRAQSLEHREILLEQRPSEQTVMPGLWELPPLCDAVVPEPQLLLTVRHAIMQVNYRVRIRTVLEENIDALTARGGLRRWVRLDQVAEMALTGLTRKVLKRAQLLTA
jgi:A/G-specific adenine glycosylase